MRANITFDENNYIASFNADPDGEYELPAGFDIPNAFYYQYIDGAFVLDTEKEEETQAEFIKREQIESLRFQLSQTDDDMLAFVEDLFTLKNPLTFISDMINLMKNYTTLVATRQSIREQIRGLMK